jgi:ABC-type glycerol-3-phosphate transport system substrate-binding protein
VVDHETHAGGADAARGRHPGARRMGLLGIGGAVVASSLSFATVGAQSPAGAFDPMVCAGRTVRINLVAGERDEKGLLDKEAEIEAATGVSLEVTTEAIGDLIASNNQNLTAPESPIDIIHVLGFTVAQTAGAGLLEPLQPYLDDPSKTPADYDFADFPAGQLEYAGYFDVETGQFGGDTLYLIPGIHSGSVLLFYRKDLLDAAGIAVPTTWAEYLAAAERLTTGDVAGSAMVGANDWSNFFVDWYTRFITTGGQLTSGDKNDGTLQVHLDSPEGVAALQNMIDLKPFSPEAVTTYGFTEALNAFMAGKVALWPAWATIAGALYGPDSPVKDTVAVAQVPADDGNPRGIRGGWGLGIPANLPQERKDCAWHILTYITSKDFEKYQVMTYQTDPNRSSTGSDAEISAALPYIPDAVTAIETAQILEVANLPEAFEIVGLIAEQVNLALTGTQDAATAMANAQAAVTAVLQRQGYQSAG